MRFGELVLRKGSEGPIFRSLNIKGMRKYSNMCVKDVNTIYTKLEKEKEIGEKREEGRERNEIDR